MANPGLSEITATTLRNRTKKLADNVSNNTALLHRLKARGRIKPVGGGEDILQELMYRENSTAGYYSGYEHIDITPQDVITAAHYAWKQASVSVSISGLEGDVQNTGMERMIDLLDARIENAEISFVNLLSDGLYSDGTGYGGKEITGLQAQLPTNPTTGTVGGINRATTDGEFWRNQYDTAGALSDPRPKMEEMWLKTCRNREKIDLIPADNNTYRAYWTNLQDQQRFTDPKMAQMGFASLKFNTADVVLDGGLGGNMPANRMYFLNTMYIHWRPHRSRDMVMLSPDRYAVNQDAMVKIIVWAGNMTLSNAMLQGVASFS